MSVLDYFLEEDLAILVVALVVFSGQNQNIPGVSIDENGNNGIGGSGGNVQGQDLKTFSSVQEIKAFLEENIGEQGYDGYGMEESAGGIRTFAADSAVAPNAATGSASAGAKAESASDYSETNIQVEGVDEADIVKNDGKYIHTVTDGNVVIVEAFPAEDMKVLGEIDLEEYVSNIYIYGDTLILFTSGGEYIDSGMPCVYDSFGAMEMFGRCGGYYKQTTNIYTYDVSDRENPELKDAVEADGYLVDSRMIDEYVYVVSSKHINTNYFDLPVYTINDVAREAIASDVSYFGEPDYGYTFTSVMAFNVRNGDFESEIFLLGSSQNVFVSQDNIFLTYPKQVSQREMLEDYVEMVLLPLLPDEEDEEINEVMESDDSPWEMRRDADKVLRDYVNGLNPTERAGFSRELSDALESYQEYVAKQSDRTIVHKISIDEDEIEYIAEGEFPGHVLNQFSMDEYEGNFRVATTTGNVWGGNSLNHLFVLDDNLEVIGSVEDLAKGEKIYSARFMGGRAYIVTFKKVDPFYVIDLSNPEEPAVLGYLKIPGYSDYLHPYDENHVIGIGKDAEDAEESLKEQRDLDFAWYQGVKVSLFDVSDVENPVEKAKIVIGDRGTDSSALYDHKAFLFDKERGILVLPITLAEIPDSQKQVKSNTYGKQVWRGAYVLNIDEDEISVRGRITHDEDKETLRPASEEPVGAERYDYSGRVWIKIAENKWEPGSYQGGYYYTYTDENVDYFPGGANDYNRFDYRAQIQRSLYMDDVLYTISNKFVKANGLNTLSEIDFVELPVQEYEGYYGIAEGGMAIDAAVPTMVK